MTLTRAASFKTSCATVTNKSWRWTHRHARSPSRGRKKTACIPSSCTKRPSRSAYPARSSPSSPTSAMCQCSMTRSLWRGPSSLSQAQRRASSKRTKLVRLCWVLATAWASRSQIFCIETSITSSKVRLDRPRRCCDLAIRFGRAPRPAHRAEKAAPCVRLATEPRNRRTPTSLPAQPPGRSCPNLERQSCKWSDVPDRVPCSQHHMRLPTAAQSARASFGCGPGPGPRTATPRRTRIVGDLQRAVIPLNYRIRQPPSPTRSSKDCPRCGQNAAR